MHYALRKGHKQPSEQPAPGRVRGAHRKQETAPGPPSTHRAFALSSIKRGRRTEGDVASLI